MRVCIYIKIRALTYETFGLRSMGMKEFDIHVPEQMDPAPK